VLSLIGRIRIPSHPGSVIEGLPLTMVDAGFGSQTRLFLPDASFLPESSPA
jgi:hypothetical protein